MTYAQTMRLIWIDAMLSKYGIIRRADICNMFLITKAVASLDLRAYQAAFPVGICHDKSAKFYRRVGTDSLFDDDSRATVADTDVHIRHWAMMDLT